MWKRTAGFWLDSLHETGQKQDPTAQGRDHREAVAFCGEEENAKFDLGHLKMRLPMGHPNRNAWRQFEFQVWSPGEKDLEWRLKFGSH